MTPVVYMMIGCPGAGKSTWIKNQDWLNDAVIISSDNHLLKYAEKLNKSITEIFDEYIEVCINHMVDDLNNAINDRKNIIWDQTNLTKNSRARKLKMVQDYKKIAVVFRQRDFDILSERLKNRKSYPIPDEVLFQMIQNFQEPSEDEGFDDIWYN